jgi:hypothetical protein
VHTAIAIVPFGAFAAVDDVRRGLRELVQRSAELTVPSAVLAHRYAPRYNFADPSLQLAWSAPGFALSASTLFPAETAAAAATAPPSQPSVLLSPTGNGKATGARAASPTRIQLGSPMAASLPPGVSSAASSGSNGGGGSGAGRASPRVGSSAASADGGSSAGMTMAGFSLTADFGVSASAAAAATATPGSAMSTALAQQQASFPGQPGSSGPLPPLKASLLPLLRAFCAMGCKLSALVEWAHDSASSASVDAALRSFADAASPTGVSTLMQSAPAPPQSLTLSFSQAPLARAAVVRRHHHHHEQVRQPLLGVYDITYKVDDHSWATIKIVGGRATGVMVLCAQPHAMAEQAPLADLLRQSNAVSSTTFEGVYSTMF